MSSARSFVREITSVDAGQDKTRNATFINTNPHGICLQKVVNGQGQESAKVIIAFKIANEKKQKKITASIGFYGCIQSMSGTFLGATGWSGEKIMHKVACIESCRAVDNAVYAVHNQVNIGATHCMISPIFCF